MLVSSSPNQSASKIGPRVFHQECFAAVIEECQPMLTRLARKYLTCEEDVADALQETFLSALRSLQQFSGKCEIKTWLYRIMTNTCLTKLRSQSRKPSCSLDRLMEGRKDGGTFLDPIAGDWQIPPLQFVRSEQVAQLREAIESLAEENRRVIMLRDIEGLNTRTTAERLGIRPGAVKTRLHRARKALKVILVDRL